MTYALRHDKLEAIDRLMSSCCGWYFFMLQSDLVKP